MSSNNSQTGGSVIAPAVQMQRLPAIRYAENLVLDCLEQGLDNAALITLGRWVTAIVTLYETHCECTAHQQVIDAEMSEVAANEAVLVRQERADIKLLDAKLTSISLKKQEVSVRVGDIRSRMPLLLEIQAMDSALSDAMSLCRQ